MVSVSRPQLWLPAQSRRCLFRSFFLNSRRCALGIVNSPKQPDAGQPGRECAQSLFFIPWFWGYMDASGHLRIVAISVLAGKGLRLGVHDQGGGAFRPFLLP